MNNYNGDYYNNNSNIYNNPFNNSDMNNQKKAHTFYKRIVLFLFSIFLIVTGYFFISSKSKSYLVRLNSNGADEMKDKVMECKSNLKGQCYITLPNVKRTNGEVFGYSANPNSREAEYKIGDTIEITSDVTLYVISKKVNTLIIDKSNIDEIQNDNLSCEVYNTDDSCEVNVPMFNKLGYKIDGYVKSQDDKNNIISFGSKLKLNDSITIYPLFDEYPNYVKSGKTHFNIDKSVYIYNTYLDIGQGCDSNISNKLIAYLKKIYDAYPFLAYYSKLSVLSENEYNSFAVASGFGVSSGFTDEFVYKNPTVLVRCDNELYMYTVAIHELAHAMDVRYKDISGHYLSDEKEIIDLRNKYKNNSNRPLCDYAYSDKGDSFAAEFFAELLTFYYINYVDTTTELHYKYKRGNFPLDMKQMAEKYLCIGKNNYNINNCS